MWWLRSYKRSLFPHEKPLDEKTDAIIVSSDFLRRIFDILAYSVDSGRGLVVNDRQSPAESRPDAPDHLQRRHSPDEMGSRSKKSKKTKEPQSEGKKFSKTEDLGYYFLAAIGLLILALLVVGILGYFQII